MTEIFRTIFGSHLYGTWTKDSDIDWKAVIVPSARDILLGRIKDSQQSNTKQDKTARNKAGDVDVETHSLARYLKLVAEGQTVALDMLFATPLVNSYQIKGRTTGMWMDIWRGRDKIASRQCASFLGYCRTQANKYGIKGSRVAAADKAIEVLAREVERLGTTAKLHEANLSELIGVEHIEVVDIQSRDGRTVRHLSVCNLKAPFDATIKNALEISARTSKEYGERARKAQANENIDWKALSHAVRIGRQAVEYLSTGHITFPRPEAPHLLAIKNGNLRYAYVAAEIETLLDVVEATAAHSPLPEKPDQAWIDDFIIYTHKEQIRLTWN